MMADSLRKFKYSEKDKKDLLKKQKEEEIHQNKKWAEEKFLAEFTPDKMKKKLLEAIKEDPNSISYYIEIEEGGDKPYGWYPYLSEKIIDSLKAEGFRSIRTETKVVKYPNPNVTRSYGIRFEL